MEKENNQTKNHFDIFDWLKKHTIVTCIIIFCILIVIPISFYVPSLIGFIPREEAGNVLGYYGAIIGGALTLLGVWWTINEQKNDLKEQQKNLDLQRQNDLSIQYKPIFSLEFSHSLVSNFLYDNTSISFYLTFKNVGRGEATSMDTEYPRSIMSYAFMLSYEENQIIVPNNSCYLMISIAKTGKQTGEDTYEIVSLDQNDKIELPISIKFNDSFENQYIYKYTISFACQTTIDSQEVKSFTLKDGNPILEMKDPNKKISEPSWIATISKPKIEYISNYEKKS